MIAAGSATQRVRAALLRSGFRMLS